MTKFTKGEWSVSLESLASVNCDGKHIAMANHFNTHNKEHCVNENECVANAHLIASAPEMYRMIDELHKELILAINEVNMHRAKEINCQSETEPDYWDAQSCFEAQLLLKKARGE